MRWLYHTIYTILFSQQIPLPSSGLTFRPTNFSSFLFSYDELSKSNKCVNYIKIKSHFTDYRFALECGVVFLNPLQWLAVPLTKGIDVIKNLKGEVSNNAANRKTIRSGLTYFTVLYLYIDTADVDILSIIPVHVSRELNTDLRFRRRCNIFFLCSKKLPFFRSFSMRWHFVGRVLLESRYKK